MDGTNRKCQSSCTMHSKGVKAPQISLCDDTDVSFQTALHKKIYYFLHFSKSVNACLKSPLFLNIHCITLYYAQQEISWKPGKTSKFRPIHSTIQIWTDFHKNEAKKFFFEEKNSKWPFFKIANSQNFFAKISQIGPWVSRID